MATSSCPKCGNHTFEVKQNTPQQSRYVLLFVQCASCGTVVGVLDYYNIGAQMIQQNKAIKTLAQKLQVHVDLET